METVKRSCFLLIMHVSSCFASIVFKKNALFLPSNHPIYGISHDSHPTPCVYKPRIQVVALFHRAKNVEGVAITELERAGYKRQNVPHQMQDTVVVLKLKKEFPSAEEGVIRDVVQWWGCIYVYNEVMEMKSARCIKAHYICMCMFSWRIMCIRNFKLCCLFLLYNQFATIVFGLTSFLFIKVYSLYLIVKLDICKWQTNLTDFRINSCRQRVCTIFIMIGPYLVDIFHTEQYMLFTAVND